MGVGGKKDRILDTDLIVFGKLVFFSSFKSTPVPRKKMCSWSLTQSSSVNDLPEGHVHFSSYFGCKK